MISQSIQEVLTFHMPNQNVVAERRPRLFCRASCQFLKFLVQNLDQSIVGCCPLINGGLVRRFSFNTDGI